MTTPRIKDRLAVCSWSLQPKGPEELVDHLKRLDIRRTQIALDPIRSEPSVWAPFKGLCEREGIELISGMMVTIGEDYSSMESIRETGGIVPDATWEENLKNFEANADLARSLGLSLVTFHAGFMPDDPDAPGYKKLQDRLTQTTDLLGEREIRLGLETGQETADHLAAFLTLMKRATLGVNFDPANMILYDKGDPIQALRTLSNHLFQCHIKDANKTTESGTWGEEMAAGQGQVDWKAFFAVLQDIGYTGDLAFEREAGDQRFEDIQSGSRYVESINP